jgi:hypothetical protein
VKVIARIKGGLGNQLFCYAAARRLALANDAELVIDDVTGFVRDRLYGRRYLLDRFRIPCRKALPAERLEPFERVRRGVLKWLDRRRPFFERWYLEQETLEFDPRLLSYSVRGMVYLDGLWQSEGYFKDVEQVIRRDFEIVPPDDEANRALATRLQELNAVAVHVRWFDPPDRATSKYNLPSGYYRRAIAEIERRVSGPTYVIFSDQPRAAVELLALPSDRVIAVTHNGGARAYADLWLMTECRHFVIANSTFSWWGAWLAPGPCKTVIAPGWVSRTGVAGWGFDGLIPECWTVLNW